MQYLKSKNRAEWLRIRQSGIGGSDVAGIMGISPWKKPVDVWLEKTGRDEKDNQCSLSIKLGTQLESFVAQEYQEQTGNRVQNYNFTIRDDVLLGNIDRLIVPAGKKTASHINEIRTNALLECKTATCAEWETPPLYYQAQVMHYMGLEPQFEYADVACLFFLPFGGKSFRVYRVERDESLIRSMQEFLKDWWEKHVADDCPPEPSSEDDVKKIWRKSQPVSLEATPEIIASVCLLRDVKNSMRELKEEEQKLRDEVARFMKDAEALTDFDGKTILTYKTAQNREVVDDDGLRKALADLAGIDEVGLDVLKKKHSFERPGSRLMLVK